MQFVDHLAGHPEDLEMNDATSRVSLYDVDNPSEERVVAVPGHDHATDGDPGRIVGLIEERPHVAVASI